MFRKKADVHWQAADEHIERQFKNMFATLRNLALVRSCSPWRHAKSNLNAEQPREPELPIGR